MRNGTFRLERRSPTRRVARGAVPATSDRLPAGSRDHVVPGGIFRHIPAWCPSGRTHYRLCTHKGEPQTANAILQQFLCAEKKIYPVPGGPKRSQALAPRDCNNWAKPGRLLERKSTIPSKPPSLPAGPGQKIRPSEPMKRQLLIKNFLSNHIPIPKRSDPPVFSSILHLEFEIGHPHILWLHPGPRRVFQSMTSERG